MKCPRCYAEQIKLTCSSHSGDASSNHQEGEGLVLEHAIRRSRSRDHFFLRLILMKCVRCYRCMHHFYIPFWTPVPEPLPASQAQPLPLVEEPQHGSS